MINVLVPMAGRSPHYSIDEFPFPKPLVEICSKTLIERVVDNLKSAADQINLIFIVSNDDCKKYHLDSSINILTDRNCTIIKLENETMGSACSALMAIQHIDNNTPLLIANYDQIFDVPICSLINEIRIADAGVVTFDSVHPRWSYARTDEQGNIVETAEKRPISRNAIAGLYYFSRGKDFVSSAMKSIQKDENINGVYYISPAINQMILSGKIVRMAKVENRSYHTFYMPSKITEYEQYIKSNDLR